MTSIRQPAVAGQFYSGNPTRLREDLQHFEQEAGPSPLPEGARLRAAVSPHAGYTYSGPTAVKTLAAAKNGDYQRVMVLAPSHRMVVGGVALSDHSAFNTPFGDMVVDEAATRSILENRNPLIQASNRPHDGEHALEVQLPIIQYFLPDAVLVAGVCGGIDVDSARRIAASLAPLWDPETLWVISSDFTHYGRSFGYLPFTERIPEKLSELDLGAVETITNLDLEGFSDYVDRTGATICGANPIKILLAVIERVKTETAAPRAKLIDYTTSGESTGDYSHCVSYAGVAFYSQGIINK